MVVDYSKTYQQKTGQAVSTFGGHAYDGLMILVQAMQRAKSADKAKVRDEIASARLTFCSTSMTAVPSW